MPRELSREDLADACEQGVGAEVQLAAGVLREDGERIAALEAERDAAIARASRAEERLVRTVDIPDETAQKVASEWLESALAWDAYDEPGSEEPCPADTDTHSADLNRRTAHLIRLLVARAEAAEAGLKAKAVVGQ